MDLTFSEPFALAGITQNEYEANEEAMVQAYADNVGVQMASSGRRLQTDAPEAEVTVQFLGWDENNYLRIVFTVVITTGDVTGDALIAAAESNKVTMLGVMGSEDTGADIAAVFIAVGVDVTAEAAGEPELSLTVVTSGVGQTENMQEAQSCSMALKEALQEACGASCSKVLCLDALFVETEDVILTEKNVTVQMLTDEAIDSCADQNQKMVRRPSSSSPSPLLPSVPSPPFPPPPAFFRPFADAHKLTEGGS